ncbi:MAG: hypothetical protein IJ500_00790 [Alphaproteobacteria bacterium]|nr:hypothetical protein [Alphaproteobacteria bacterium]
MSKKTFKFNVNKKSLETNCDAPNQHCPIVQFYRAGIDTQVTIRSDNVFVKFPKPFTPETAETMYSIGQSMCNCCKYNADKAKVK